MCEYHNLTFTCVCASFDAAKHDINVLRRLIAFSRRWVHSLRLQQFPAHLDLGILFEFLYR